MTLSEATDRSQLPFRCHLGPIETHGRYDDWVDAMEAHSLVVWTGRDLYRDMTAVLERRLIESERGKFVDEHGQRELPLGGARAAPLSAICAFLARRTDDGRIAALAAGLAWARPHARDASIAPGLQHRKTAAESRHHVCEHCSLDRSGNRARHSGCGWRQVHAGPGYRDGTRPLRDRHGQDENHP